MRQPAIRRDPSVLTHPTFLIGRTVGLQDFSAFVKMPPCSLQDFPRSEIRDEDGAGFILSERCDFLDLGLVVSEEPFNGCEGQVAQQ